jgi:hypothetical protein
MAVLEVEPIIAIQRLDRDLRQAAETLTPAEARYMVDLYYTMQEDRKRAANQVRSTEDEEPNEVLTFFLGQAETLEQNIKQAMDSYSDSQVIGQWAKSIYGIGPVLSAGLMAHIDMDIATNPSKIWRFAGLDPTVRWEKGQRRPWNARLKVLCWKIGESFKKFHNREACFYGHIYSARKELEVERNERGDFAETARVTLEAKNIRAKETRECYDAGKLPPGRLDLRATRYATKLFLSHWWQVAYIVHYGEQPAKPWILEQGGHADIIPVPNWPL